MLVLLCALPGQAQVPTVAEFEAAVDAVRPLAATQGLSLRTDGLWLELLRSGTPMMALRRGPACHIGYSAYLAQRRYAALFPELPPKQALAWLDALVHHELMHCANVAPAGVAAVAGTSESATAGAAVVAQEALADLAFAQHLDSVTPEADTLIMRLIDLREKAASRDPKHATAGALSCYLKHPQRRDVPQLGELSWLARLRIWQHRCASAQPP